MRFILTFFLLVTFFIMVALCISTPAADTIVHGNSTVSVSPNILAIKNPYAVRAAVYKGQLHMHSTNSDGLDSPTAIVTAYRDIGFDFVALTDHDVVTADPGVEGILFITGVEETASTGVKHIGVVNVAEQSSSSDDQTIITAAFNVGGLAFINHPDIWGAPWSDYVIAQLQNFVGIEIWNGHMNSAEGRWDRILSMGRYLVGVAADDCHNIAGLDFGVSWVMVNSDTLTVDDIIANIRAGNFYSTTGPTLTPSVTAGTISVTTDSAATIEFIGKDAVALQTNTTATSAAYQVTGAEGYVRIKITRDSDSETAWSNPFFIGGF